MLSARHKHSVLGINYFYFKSAQIVIVGKSVEFAFDCDINILHGIHYI